MSDHHRHAPRARDSDEQVAAPGARPVMLTALVLTAGFAAVEAFCGWWANSLALVSDAGHMAGDAGALLVALVAARLAARPVSERNSYGYGRAEIIGAFINALTMLAIVVWIVVAAVTRVFNPLPMAGAVVMLVAALGLGVNLIVLWLLTRGSAQGRTGQVRSRDGHVEHGHSEHNHSEHNHSEHNHSARGHSGHSHGDINTRAAVIHVLGDLLGSVAAIIAGAVVHFTGWTMVDPLLSVLVALLILRSTWRVLAESAGVLMESVPHGVDYSEVGRCLAALEGVVSLHDLHVWQMGAQRRALSAHLLLQDVDAWPRVLTAARVALRERFGIDHVTLQPEWLPAYRAGRVIALKVEPAERHGNHPH